MAAPIKNKKLGKADGHLTLRLQKYIIDDLNEIAASEGKERSELTRDVLTCYVNQRRKKRKKFVVEKQKVSEEMIRQLSMIENNLNQIAKYYKEGSPQSHALNVWVKDMAKFMKDVRSGDLKN